MPYSSGSKKLRSVSLALGSGGARGYAHIGVIRWLTEKGLKIESIAGSSMGALVGGIYATGKMDVYTEWACALEKRHVLGLLDFTFGRSGLLKGEKVMDSLRELIGDANIEDLPVAFTAVATDITNEKEVWLDSGPLFDAIRASIGIPTLFTPLNLDGRILVDGGLLNPIPIAPTVRDNTDLTIAVNLSGKGKVPEKVKPPSSPLPCSNWDKYRGMVAEFIGDVQQRLVSDRDQESEMGLLDVVSQSIDIMQATISRFKLASHSPDIIIDVPKACAACLEFDKAEEVIELGYYLAGEILSPYFNEMGFDLEG